MGSVYESLLELHPELDTDAATFELKVMAGHERKTTGSYYTPTSLIRSLLDTALEPVLDEAAAAGDPAQAILDLKVCDPACGSGHFLIAAAHRMARRLAATRTGDDEPAPQAIRAALRDVIGHCIYGVDVNPMAVELCKVGLWMEALEPGRPLSFLDHRIQCGNSLLGATPELMAAGIPDEAFEPIEGDDKKIASALRKQNKQERNGQISFFAQLVAETAAKYEVISGEAEGLDEIEDRTISDIHRKESEYQRLTRSPDYQHAKLAADAWCAAFVWPKAAAAPPAVTHDTFCQLQEDPDSVSRAIGEEIRRLAGQYQYFHWHLAFPDVFVARDDGGHAPARGFDVVLGNPPWERLKLQEKEFFGGKNDEIADAPNAAKRRRLIARLEDDDPSLFRAFLETKREAEGKSHFVRSSDRYPLCGRGDVNTYSIFAELKRDLISPTGRVGCIVPSGIATDDTTKYFFQDLVKTRTLSSLYDFENRKGIFPGVHRSYKFCLLTLVGLGRPLQGGAEFAFFLHDTADLRDEERRFTLTDEDIALINPNTETCPIFRTRRDAEITKGIYQRVPVLVKEGPPEENPWGVSFMRMFDMANDSHYFRTRDELESDGWTLQGNIFVKGEERYLPLYEAKMVGMYDHRVADVVLSRTAVVRQGQPSELTDEEHRDPYRFALPRYWVSETDYAQVVNDRWSRDWLMGWRDITSPTNERTILASIIPRAGCGHTFLLLFPSRSLETAHVIVANLNSYVIDYVARQKLGGIHMTYHIFKQLPVLPPNVYNDDVAWQPGMALSDWLTRRILALTYTAHDLEQFANDVTKNVKPYSWDPESRFQLQCELDAAFLHLYRIPRHDAEYILDSFPIVKRKELEKFGLFRTKNCVLKYYDAFSLNRLLQRDFQSKGMV
jgi:hypothetical protein